MQSSVQLLAFSELHEVSIGFCTRYELSAHGTFFDNHSRSLIPCFVVDFSILSVTIRTRARVKSNNSVYTPSNKSHLAKKQDHSFKRF
jgi:hypothetical protein